MRWQKDPTRYLKDCKKTAKRSRKIGISRQKDPERCKETEKRPGTIFKRWQKDPKRRQKDGKKTQKMAKI